MARTIAHHEPAKAAATFGALPDWHSTFSANADTASNTVYVRGVLDLLTTELLRGTVDVLMSTGRWDITMDLSGLRQVDHAGVLLLARLRHDLTDRGGSLRLIKATTGVRQALGAAGLAVADAPAQVAAAHPRATRGYLPTR